MRILMLGNSFTYFNDMPDTLAELTKAEVVSYTRGGAHLSEQLNPDTEMGARTLKALDTEQWDYVVLQEYSNGPITTENAFRRSVSALCEKIRAAGAEPVLYATWAYKEDGKRLKAFGMEYEEMYRKIRAASIRVAEENNMLMADVGRAFYERAATVPLYNTEDDYHPSAEGSRVAAEVIAETILSHAGK